MPTIRQEDREFVVVTDDGREVPAAGIVAASGSFSNPYRPVFPGQTSFTGRVLHVAEYRNPCSLPSTATKSYGATTSGSGSTRSSSPPATGQVSTTLHELGALDPWGEPLHVGGISTTHLGLVYVGLEHQRSFASNALRGVSADAAAAVAPLVAWIRDAPAMVGITEVATSLIDLGQLDR